MKYVHACAYMCVNIDMQEEGKEDHNLPKRTRILVLNDSRVWRWNFQLFYFIIVFSSFENRSNRIFNLLLKVYTNGVHLYSVTRQMWPGSKPFQPKTHIYSTFLPSLLTYFYSGGAYLRLNGMGRWTLNILDMNSLGTV